MPIAVACPSCGARFNAPDGFAGRKISCTTCKLPLRVPTKPGAPPVPAVYEEPDPPVQTVPSAPPRTRGPRQPDRVVELLPAHRAEETEASPPSAAFSIALGIAALVLGVVAFGLSWIPLIGVFTTALSGLGLLLALVGGLVAIARRGRGVGFPIAGAAVNLLALAVAVGVTLVLHGALNRMVDNDDERDRTNPVSTPATGKTSEPRQPAPDNKPAPEPAKPPSEWADASREAVTQGDLRVRVTGVKVDFVRLHELGDTESKEKDLLIVLQIENTSATRKIDYRGWGAMELLLDQERPRLTDNFGNLYKRVEFGIGSQVEGQITTASIYPGKAVTDVLVFERPVEGVEFLRLELPARNVEGSGKLCLEIPRTMIGAPTPAGGGLSPSMAADLANFRQGLASRDPAVRARAVERVGRMGPLAAPVVPDLIAALRDPQPEVRSKAARALGQIGPAARGASVALIRALGDKEASVRDEATTAMEQIGPPSKEEARAWVARLVPGKADVPALARALKSGAVGIRYYGALGLAMAGPEARDALPALLEAGDDPDRDVQQAAVQSLSKLGRPAASDVPALRHALKAQNPPVRAYAAQSLGQLGADGKPALADLMAVLHDRSAPVRARALEALSGVGGEPRDMIPACIAALKDSAAEVREQAAQALTKIGADAVPALAQLLKGGDRAVALEAISVLRALAPQSKDVVGALLAAVADDDEAVCMAAIRALGEIGPEAHPAAPALIGRLREKRFRSRAVDALARMGKPTVPDLVKGLADKDLWTRLGCAQALRQIGPAAKEAVPALSRTASSDPSASVRSEAQKALGSIAPD